MAVVLDTQVAVISTSAVRHDNVENAVISIRSSPGVTDNPVGSVNTIDDLVVPSDNADNVVGENVVVAFRVDTAGVCLQTLSGHNGARNWSTCIDLSLDLIGVAGSSIVANCVALGVVNLIASSIWFARSAEIVGRALLVLGLIVVAGLINKTVSVGVLPDSEIVTTVARSSTTTVDDFLDTQVGGREGSFAHDVDTISESASDTMSPAATAVLGDVLVAHSGEVVLSVNVSPVPCIWDISGLQIFPGKGLGDVLASLRIRAKLFISDESMELSLGHNNDSQDGKCEQSTCHGCRF